MKKTLWTRNFTLVTVATIIGAMGGIMGSYALSFMVFDETGSTLASALIIAIRLLPDFFIPMIASVWMDRLPRKPFLVGGDALNAVAYGLAGIYLIKCSFNYTGYLFFSLILGCLGAFDRLAYQSIYPKLIPQGMEDKGYSVSGMVYPVMQVLMAPVSAILYDKLGVGYILLGQAGLSALAAIIESNIRLKEESRMTGERFSFRLWWADVREAYAYLKKEKGLLSIFTYMGITNGIAQGYSPILIAFFSTAAGFTKFMYSLFTVAECIGRSLGGLFRYHRPIKKEHKFRFAFFVYVTYESMDAILLWLPYPLMLINRAVCGFLGINSATLRSEAVQRYIPETMRSRISAFEEILMSIFSSVLTLLIGFMGDHMDPRVCITCLGGACVLAVFATIWRRRKEVSAIYNA